LVLVKVIKNIKYTKYNNIKEHEHKMSTNKSKGVIPPINCIFNYLQQQTTVTFWLYEQTGIRIRGKISGFDEFMNIVIDDALEIPVDSKTSVEMLDKSKKLGKIMLKGDNITLITSVDE